MSAPLGHPFSDPEFALHLSTPLESGAPPTMKKRIDVAAIARIVGTLYPPPFDQPCRGRARQKLGDVAGLTQFGVNLLHLPPGAWSSQRHWHTVSDEFVYVLSGDVTLVTDGGEEILHAGDAAGFKAGDTNGHCLQNRSNGDVYVLEIGTRAAEDSGYYSDIDMMAPAGGKPAMYMRRDGTPYEGIKRRGPEE
jgi:uncharacterized cupin superfamily protein